MKFILNPQSASDIDGPIFVGLAVIVIGLLYVSSRILKVPAIVIESSGIRFHFLFYKGKTIGWNDIKSITLTAKRNRGFLLNDQEVSLLHLKDGRNIVIWADFYRNAAQIRIMLERANSLLQEGKLASIKLPIKSTKPTGINKLQSIPPNEEFKKYRGNPHFSFNGIVCYGFILAMLLIGLNSGNLKSPAMLLLLLPAMAAYLSIGSQLHYFLVSKNFLVVRNHFLFWRKHAYSIADIGEVLTERPYRRSMSLRVITKDFNDKLYSAGSLNSRTWEELIREFRNLGINIRGVT